MSALARHVALEVLDKLTSNELVDLAFSKMRSCDDVDALSKHAKARDEAAKDAFCKAIAESQPSIRLQDMRYDKSYLLVVQKHGSTIYVPRFRRHRMDLDGDRNEPECSGWRHRKRYFTFRNDTDIYDGYEDAPCWGSYDQLDPSMYTIHEME